MKLRDKIPDHIDGLCALLQLVVTLGYKVLRTAGFLGNTADSVCGLLHHGVDL